MNTPVPSRQRILECIHAAIQPPAKGLADAAVAYAVLPRDYVRRGKMSAAARLELMIERLREYDAEVIESTPEALPAAIASQLAASGKHTFVAPPGLSAEWLAPGFDWTRWRSSGARFESSRSLPAARRSVTATRVGKNHCSESHAKEHEPQACNEL